MQSDVGESEPQPHMDRSSDVVIANKAISVDKAGHSGHREDGLEKTPVKEKKNGESADGKLESPRTRRLLETTLVWTVIVVVWALLSLPIIFYHINIRRVCCGRDVTDKALLHVQV